MIMTSLLSACHQRPVENVDPPNPDESAGEASDEELIIGGHNVTKKSEIAATTISLLDSDQGTLCTATLLSETVAITAAHCIDGNPGSMQLSFGPRTSGVEVRSVTEAIQSPVWLRHQRSTFNNGDIGLIHFSGGLPKGFFAAAVMKASHQLSHGEIVILAGFGINNGSGGGAGRLRTVDVKIDDAHYSASEISLDQTEHGGACHGDSGGPAFIQDNAGGLLLWGVTSRGINDQSDRCAGDSVYTRIQPYARWINSVTLAWKKKQ